MSAVLAFPKRNKGRVRKSSSVASMGRLALMQLERDGGNPPFNVALLGYKQPETDFTQSPELLLALSCFEALDGEQKRKVRETVATLAYGHFNPCALQLHSLLRQVRP